MGGGSVGGSGSRGGESKSVRTHNRVTKTAGRPTLHNLLVPVTGMLPFIVAESLCSSIALALSHVLLSQTQQRHDVSRAGFYFTRDSTDKVHRYTVYTTIASSTLTQVNIME